MAFRRGISIIEADVVCASVGRVGVSCRTGCMVQGTVSAPDVISVIPCAPVQLKARLSPQLRATALPGWMGLAHVMFWTSARVTEANKKTAVASSSLDAVGGSNVILIADLFCFRVACVC